MNRKNLIVRSSLAAVVIAGVVGSVAIAQQGSKDKAPHGAPEMKLPDGWTMDDMQACMIAGTPGEMHQFIAKGAGTWKGTSTMWMGPGSDPMKSETIATISMVMDGRYAKCEYAGEIPGMGAFNGLGYSGFDNVTQKFVSTWIDNHSSGIMQGTGSLSADKKTLTWNYSYNCPITKKPAVMRQVETYKGDNAMTLEMFGNDPKSGKEYKMMSIDFARTNAAAK